MRKTLMSALAAAALAAAAPGAQAREDVCKVLSSWTGGGVRTSQFGVGEPFRVKVGDGATTRALAHPESGLTVKVGVEYFGVAGPRREVRLAIALAGGPGGVFDEVDRAEARTLHGPGWAGLVVVKAVRLGGREYTYSFDCVNAKVWDGWRGPARRRARGARGRVGA